MDEVIVIAIIFGSVFLFLIFVSTIQSRKSRQKWQKIADDLGLAFEGGNLLFRKSKIKGVYRKHRVLFDIYMESRTIFTQLNLDFENKENITLSIFYKRAFDKMGNLLGDEIHFEDNPQFDSKFTIRGNDEGFIRSFLDLPIQDRILGLGKFNIIRIKDNKAYFREIGIITDSERLKTIISLISDIVDRIEKD